MIALKNVIISAPDAITYTWDRILSAPNRKHNDAMIPASNDNVSMVCIPQCYLVSMNASRIATASLNSTIPPAEVGQCIFTVSSASRTVLIDGTRTVCGVTAP